MPTPIRILVVDDDVDVAKGTCRVLDRAGYGTAMAHTGAEAMRSLSLVQPQLVLLDRLLPDQDGLDVCRAIKNDPALADVFVVIASAVFCKHEEQVAGLEAGADAYLTRPIGNRELLARVEAFARIARINSALRAEVERRRVLEEELELRVTARTAELLRANEALEQARQRLALANDDLRKEVAERQQLRDQLAQVQKMESIGRLAGGVAHDFNNMLGVILGHTELAISRLDATSPVAGDLTEIRAASVRSADLVRQLLAFARKQTVSPQVLSLNDTVDGMLKMLRRLIGEDIDLVWRPGHDVGPIKIDPSQLGQVLTNLCVNARDAIAGVGTLTITTANVELGAERCAGHPDVVPGRYVQLTVADSGSGMTSDVLANVFEPFFTTKEPGQGTGLGLATVYGVVRQNRGLIEVTSAPGQGTTFNICLPRHRSGLAGDASDTENGATPLRRGTETILLVEDESAILLLVRTLLERLGYRVLCAGSPGEALRLATSGDVPIDLLVTDVIMPEMDGRTLADQLAPHQPRMKTLFMSGYTANVLEPHGMAADDVHFIEKPFSMAAFADKLREALDRP